MEFSPAQLVLFAIRLSAYLLVVTLIMLSVFTQTLGGVSLAFLSVTFAFFVRWILGNVDPFDMPDPQKLNPQCVVLVSDLGTATATNVPTSIAITSFILAAMVQFMSDQWVENLTALLSVATLLVLDAIHNLMFRCQSGPPMTDATPPTNEDMRTITTVVGSLVGIVLFIVSIVQGYGWLTGTMTLGGLVLMVGRINDRTLNAARIVVTGVMAAMGGYAYALVIPKQAPGLALLTSDPVTTCSAPELRDIINGNTA